MNILAITDSQYSHVADSFTETSQVDIVSISGLSTSDISSSWMCTDCM